MTSHHKPFSRTAARHWLIQTLAACLTVSLAACAPYGERVAPVPLPSPRSDHIDIQGALLTAQPYPDPQQAEAAFGFDIRGAGLLPVRFSLDNRSDSVVRINPQQTFLIDLDGQAWPVLTADQAYNRISRAVEFQEIGKAAGKSAALIGAAGAVTGFALGVLLGEGVGKTTLQGVEVGTSVGAFFGGADAVYGLETKIRQDLAAKSLRNQRIQPGELAYGVLFFPGQDEARTARSLRLSIELDSYPQVVNLPLKPTSPTALSP
ncbi:MAG TPA: hypothetical protein VLU73_04160 [Methylococcaceae bacterium]|jgi:hypothetical protein|nr:hypothetical protein [Methylococcaceae bacterium]